MSELVLAPAPSVTASLDGAPQSRQERAFVALQAEIEATPPRAMNVSWAHVARAVDGALEAAAAQRHKLEALGDSVDLATIDALPLRVDALGYTESRCLPATRGEARQALRDEARRLRGRMKLELRALTLGGVDVPATLRPLGRGTAYDELAGDLLKLLAQLTRLRALGRPSLLTDQELAEVEPLARALLRASETRRGDAAVLAEAQLLRRKAYALVFDGYAELRSAMEYLLRRQPGTLDALVPPLARVPGRGPRKPRRTAKPEPTSARAPRF
jgi:hypothetical protein